MKTNTPFVIAFLWIITVICFALHGSYHVSGIVYGLEVKSAKANGTVPMAAHLIRIVLETGLLLLAVLTLYIQHKGFRIFLWIWSILLLPFNAFHLISTARHDLTDYSQIAVLSLVLAVNSLLIVSTRKWTKEV